MVAAKARPGDAGDATAARRRVAKESAAGAARPADPDQESLRRRVRELEKRVQALESQLSWAPPAGPATPTVPPPMGPPPQGYGPSSPPFPPPGTPPGTPGWLPVAPPAERRSVESLLGANWLARAGILLLALGVVFFLRLAYDRGWVPIPGRYAIGALGGIGLWILGDALRGRRLDPAFAQVLAGGGAVILYVTVYCGYAFPEYRAALSMSLPLVLALLAATSVLLGAYAIWRELPLLGGAAAGLATILLAPAGDFSVAGVLYATFLDTALLAAAAWRRWPPVAFTAIVAANVPILAGFAEGYDWLLLVVCSAVANAAGIAASAASRGDRTLANLQAGLALLLLAAAVAAGFDDAGLPRGPGWAALAVGAAGLALAFGFQRVGAGLGTASAILLLLWPLAQFEDTLWTPLAHGALALAAIALGAAWPRVRVGTTPTAIAGAALGLLGYWVIGTVQPEIEPAEALAGADLALAVAAGLVLAAAGLLGWLALRRHGPAGVAQVGLGSGLLAILLTVSTVLDGWPVTVSWALVAVAAVVAGMASPGLRELRLAAFGVFGLVLVRIFFVDLARLDVVGRVVAFLLTGALLLVAAFLYARGRPRAPRPTWTPVEGTR